MCVVVANLTVHRFGTIILSHNTNLHFLKSTNPAFKNIFLIHSFDA